MVLFSTPPLAIRDSPARADHFTQGRDGPISCIVIHATGGTNSLGWLTKDSPQGREVSIHRLITKRGTIHKIVSDEDTAWHAGPGHRWQTLGLRELNLNSVSLGIELENLNVAGDSYPPAQLAALVAQVVEWFGLYGFLPLLRHYEVQSNKTDPQHLPWIRFQSLLWSALRAVN